MLIRLRIQHPVPLEGARAVEWDGADLEQFAPALGAEADLDGVALGLSRRLEIAEEGEAVRHHRMQVGAAIGNRVAAVEALAVGVGAGRARALGAARYRTGPQHGIAHLQLRQPDAEPLEEQPRPGATGDDHGRRLDPALLGDDGADPARRPFDAAHRAAG
ncbi:hypothetical protein D3C72_1507470 [compost metagenome]